ncbi:MAG TPA: hypothetical protein VMZ52_18290 [Bryobacteraceae bacterium]|nr:hypothetical protein [Bryobacteraceae bacterium]
MKNKLSLQKLQLPVYSALAGLVLFSSVPPAYSQGGPSILSRGGDRPGQRGGQPANFNFFAGLSGSAESGIFPTGVDPAGNLLTVDLFGIQGEIGGYGTRQFRRSSIGLDYRGDYRHYNRKTFYNGSDHALALEYTSQFSRRFSVTATTTAGTSSRAFGGLIGSTLPSSDLFGFPTNQIFDNRTYYLQSGVMSIYRKSARASFIFGGDYFVVRRQSKALVGVNGRRATGGYDYQFGRKSSVGLNYSFIHFGFPRVFGTSDIHSLQVRYNRQLARNIKFSAGVGAYRVESLGTVVVQLSPEVASILGISNNISAIHRVDVSPQFDVSLGYARKRQTFHVGYLQGSTPGNGLYLTSQQKSANAGYAYSGIRKLSFGINAGYSRYESQFRDLQNYNSGQAGVGLSYALGHHLNFVSQGDVRSFVTQGGKRTGYSVSIGLRYSPAEVPLPIW